MATDFPKDFHPIIVKSGMRWGAAYRLPWASRTLMDGEQPQLFQSKDEATIAACKAAMNEFRNDTTGWQSEPLICTDKEIERVFGETINRKAHK